VHAALQQTPSEQLPLEHWLALVHAAPFGWSGKHAEPPQKYVVMQSVSDAQLVLHAPATQA
jgi:hypothetical protein